jgi:thioredoxin reductase (NADPH)
MSDVWDVIVVGAGPAGLAAATAAAAAGARVLSIDKAGPGGQLINLAALEGVEAPAALHGAGGAPDGPEIVGRLVDDALARGVEMGFGTVEAIEAAGNDVFLVVTDDGSHRCKAIVLATGLGAGTTGLAEEAGYLGRGISHCAHCDGPLYRGEAVVVAGNCRWTLAEAAVLAETASTVTLVSSEPFTAPEAERLAELLAAGKIRHVPGRIVALAGVDGLERLSIETGEATLELAARALFLMTDRRSDTALLAPALRDDGSRGRIVVAGDARAGQPGYLPQAIADGQRAGQNAARAALAGAV